MGDNVNNETRPGVQVLSTNQNAANSVEGQGEGVGVGKLAMDLRNGNAIASSESQKSTADSPKDPEYEVQEVEGRPDDNYDDELSPEDLTTISFSSTQPHFTAANSNPTNLPTLGYWKIRGLVQPVRFILAYTGTEYHHKFYHIGEDGSRESWLREKFNLGLDLPNLPYWIDGDIKLTQSRAILRHIARDRDPTLLGKTPNDFRRMDMLESHMWDFWMALVLFCFNYTEHGRHDFIQTLPAQFQLLSHFMGEHKWSIGDSLTYLDFMIYEALYQHQIFHPGCLDKYPRLGYFLRQFEALPAIAAYMESENFIKAPLYTRLAKLYI